jgi:Protein of unknown function DUF262/Protein of unknown function (DUF1524)
MTDKLTNNTDETSLQLLFSSPSIFAVPFFQRPYKWPPAKIRRFEADLVKVAETEGDIHFLGAVIIHGRSGNPIEAKLYQVIDGQQRLTTVYLFLAAAVRTLIEFDHMDTAKQLFRTYLVTTQETRDGSNLKLHPSGQDRPDLNDVILELMNARGFGNTVEGFTFKRLDAATSARSTRISKNYDLARRFFRQEMKDGGAERVEELYSSLLQRMTVVQIDIVDALSGPKIFDSLNSAQQPMTVGDLVKNDVFSRGINSDPDLLDREHWQPFFERFGEPKLGLFDDYFFPFGLFRNPSVKKVEVYSSLQKEWISRSLTPEEIIHELASVQSDYLDSVRGSNECEHEEAVALGFRRLWRLGAPSSALPFLMHISHGLRSEAIDDGTARSLLEALDSFLTRRAVCGYEPTGLHSVFKGMWQELHEREQISVEGFTQRILDRRTVQWPGDEEFARQIMERELYGSRITKYVVAEYDLSLDGDPLPEDDFEIEHVLPQNPVALDWKSFTTSQHEEMRDRLANLLPISPGMNREVSNGKYQDKKSTYEIDARFKSTRQFAREYSTWTPEGLIERSRVLAAWALLRWPYGGES